MAPAFASPPGLALCSGAMSSHSHPPKQSRLVHIQVHVDVIDQLFNSIDPAPFHVRELDADAHAYIVHSAKALPRDARMELVLHIDSLPADESKLSTVSQAIQTHFSGKAVAERIELQDLFARGRISLLIGLSILSLSIGLVEISKSWAADNHWLQILQQSLLIGGWVAMWRPMEIFLYDWWPMAAHIRLLRRLATIKVHIAPQPKPSASA